jgi:hypothetical protein
MSPPRVPRCLDEVMDAIEERERIPPELLDALDVGDETTDEAWDEDGGDDADDDSAPPSND